MNDTLICDELCELDLDVRSTDEFFEVMSKKAKDLGYVTEQFLSAIKKREQDYPTALPVKPYPVAIPHSDPINIVKQFIAPVRLKNAISWCEMANNDSILSVQIVFLLGFKREEGHVEILQLLLQNFQNEDTMESLLKAATKGRISGNSEANGRTLMKKVIVACREWGCNLSNSGFSYQSHAGKREYHQCQGGGSEPALFTKRASWSSCLYRYYK